MSKPCPATNIVEVPYTSLSPSVLRGVVETFVLREGTDYGQLDHSLDQKVAQVLDQLEQGKAAIYFNVVDESCNVQLKSGKVRA